MRKIINPVRQNPPRKEGKAVVKFKEGPDPGEETIVIIRR